MACERCNRDDVETTTHLLRYFDDREPDDVDLCPPCVRKVRKDDDPVRSIT